MANGCELIPGCKSTAGTTTINTRQKKSDLLSKKKKRPKSKRK